MDADIFKSRIARLYKAWQSDSASFGSGDVLLIVNGRPNPDVVFRKTFALQLWLTGYELTDTLFVMTKNMIYVAGGKKKIEVISPGETVDTVVPLKLTVLPKDSTAALKELTNLLEDIANAESKSKFSVGMVVKDNPGEGIMKSVSKFFKEKGCDIVDCSLGLSLVVAPRTKLEMEFVGNAAALSDIIIQKQILPSVEQCLDEGVDMKHSKLAEDADQLFAEPMSTLKEFISQTKLKLDADECESCFTPAIQSGGTYDLRPSAYSDDSNLSPDVIIISCGARYGTYCSGVARTYFINPDKHIESAYNTLLQVREACIEALRPGKPASDVWKAAINVIRSSSRHSTLLPAFTKNCGFLTGQEYRDSSFMINASNSNILKENMVFILSVGFNGLTSKKKSASMILNDTIQISSGPGVCLTKSKFALASVSYRLDMDSDDDDHAPEIPASMMIDNGQPRTRATRAGGKVDALQQEKEEKRKRAQQELIERKLEQARQRYSEDADNQDNENKRSANEIVNAYANVKYYPKDSSVNQIYVDMDREAMLVPINGRLVPFHIAFIKSVSKQELNNYTYFRVNLSAPGSTQAVQTLQPYADQSKVFIKELTFRAADDRNINKSLRLVKELQRRVSQREKERSDRATFVEQAPLQLNRDSRYDFKLRDLQIRPSLGGKKLTGSLATHRDGLLFTGNKGQKLEILYRNIKHAFFQPCDGTISVLLHFELNNPIVVSKKRTNFVQVFVDVVESSQDLVGANRKGYYDRDGIQEEQQERLRRNKFNEKFREFARNVEDVVAALDNDHKFEFDIPYREIMFPGVPSKTNVNVLPTVHALVALDDTPPFVMFLDEIEIAYFERVQFSLKNFDLVFVFKDFEKPIVKIRSIPRDHLDSIQQYLTESDIVYFVGTMNLQWTNILKVVKEDAAYFFTEQGGWASILGSPDEEDVSESEEESAYEEDESDDEAEDEDDEDEYDSAEITDEDDEDEDDEEEGPSWEELEEDVIREEQERSGRRGRDEDEEEDEDRRRPSKKSKKQSSSRK